MAYDVNTDYGALIDAEKAKGTGANTSYLTELETARNAKIAGLNASGTNTGGYTQTYDYTSQQTTPAATTVAGTGTGTSSNWGSASATNVTGNTNDQAAMIAQMNQNGTAWWTASPEEQARLHEENQRYAQILGGSVTYDPATGTWSGAAANTNMPVENLYAGASQEDYVNSLYAAQREAALQALKSAYDQNIIDMDALAAKIPQTYQSARNQTQASAEQSRANWNEYAAASGLNVGTGAQGTLAMNNQNMANMSNINAQEANAVNDLDTQRLKIKTQYQNDIAQAIANGDLAKAQALYQEAVRVDENLIAVSQAQANLNLSRWGANTQLDQQQYNNALQKADTLAAYGDFSGYKALGWTDEQIANAKAYWQLANGVGNFSSGSGGGNGNSGGSSGGNSNINLDDPGSPATGGNNKTPDARSLYNDQQYTNFVNRVRSATTAYDRQAAIAAAHRGGKITDAQAQNLLRQFGIM